MLFISGKSQLCEDGNGERFVSEFDFLDLFEMSIFESTEGESKHHTSGMQESAAFLLRRMEEWPSNDRSLLL